MFALEIIVESPKRTELRQLLEDFTNGPSAPGDRLWCGTFQEVGRKTRLLWTCRWQDRAAVDRFLESSEYRALLGAIRVLGTVADIRSVELADRQASGVGLPGLC